MHILKPIYNLVTPCHALSAFLLNILAHVFDDFLLENTQLLNPIVIIS